ncbi:hypothetical protein OROHE_024309 [Orobanche hederae]
MDSTFKLLAIALLMCFSLPNISRARVLDSRWKSKTTLVARLKLDDAKGSSNCWESLFHKEHPDRLLAEFARFAWIHCRRR